MWFLLPLAIFASMMVCTCRWVVPQYRKAIIRDRFTGKVWVAGPGDVVWIIPFVHHFPCYHHFDSFWIPAMGAKISVDPPEWHIITSDGVRGTLDIRVIVQINDWAQSDLLSSNESLTETAKTLIQTWAAQVVSGMTAAEVSNYNVLNAKFNSTQCYASVNEDLKRVYMCIVRIALDKGGIQLDKSYQKRLSDEMALDAARAVSTKQYDLEEYKTQRRHELERRDAEHNAALKTIETKALKEKLATLPPQQYVDLEIGTRLAESLAQTKATNVVFGQAPLGFLKT